jgi:hypothetical protein
VLAGRQPSGGGGQLSLCYRHHPDYQGKKPTRELIQRLHREHLERQAAIHCKLHGAHQHMIAKPDGADGLARHIDEPSTTHKVQVI